MFYSQGAVGQDRFVNSVFRGKTNGTFLDIGCQDWREINNTCFFEKELGWRGIGFDIEEEHKQGWIDNRPNSVFILGDATTHDYGAIAKQYGIGPHIDYLSLDLEPPDLTLKALYKLFESALTFGVVTFETDFYRPEYRYIQQESRTMFEQRGYTLVKSGPQDDFYVHSAHFKVS